MTDFNVNGSNNNFEEYNNQNAKNENTAPEEKEALFEENENAPDEPKSDSVIIRKVDKTSREALEKFFSYKEGGEDKELFGMKVSDIINKLLTGGGKTPKPQPQPDPYSEGKKYGIPEEPNPIEKYGFPPEDENPRLVYKYGIPEDMDISKGDIAPDVIEGEEPVHRPPLRDGSTNPSGDTSTDGIKGKEPPRRPPLKDSSTGTTNNPPINNQFAPENTGASLINTNNIANNINNSKTPEDVNRNAQTSMDAISEQFNINIDDAENTGDITTSFTYMKANIQATGNMAIAQIDHILDTYDLTSDQREQYEAQKADIKNMVEQQLKEIEEQYKEAMKNQKNN